MDTRLEAAAGRAPVGVWLTPTSNVRVEAGTQIVFVSAPTASTGASTQFAFDWRPVSGGLAEVNPSRVLNVTSPARRLTVGGLWAFTTLAGAGGLVGVGAKPGFEEGRAWPTAFAAAAFAGALTDDQATLVAHWLAWRYEIAPPPPRPEPGLDARLHPAEWRWAA